jgi:hypothetical protein
MYLRYCAAGHGPNGAGDGIAGTFLTPKPTVPSTFQMGATTHDLEH